MHGVFKVLLCLESSGSQGENLLLGQPRQRLAAKQGRRLAMRRCVRLGLAERPPPRSFTDRWEAAVTRSTSLVLLVGVAALVLAGGLAACGGSTTTVVQSTPPAQTVTQVTTAAAPTQPPATTAAPPAKPAPAPQSPPNVVGERLPEAKVKLQEAGYTVKATNTDTTFGILVPSHYTICKQSPPQGNVVVVLAQKYGC
jgi:hypothetical protein